MSNITTPHTVAAITPEPTTRDFWQLLKPRVMSLVVFTALVGLVVAPAAVHPVIALASILCVAVGAGASGALNMWWDADIDAHMHRTAGRPVPAGRITPGAALGFGIGLSVLSVMLLGLFTNPEAAALLAFTIFFYAVIYTMWLKRSTPQNIVIGGAAGAFPPVIGWVIATGGIALEPVLMFLVIFFWTPPHFWTLALWKEDEYARVGVPMMPNVAGEKSTRQQILFHATVLAVISLATAFTSIGGPLYLIVALGLNGWFLLMASRLLSRTRADAEADCFGAEKRLFAASLFYLFGIFLSLLVQSFLKLPENWPLIGSVI